MLSKRHIFATIILPFIVCFDSIEKGRCQTTPQATTNAPTTPTSGMTEDEVTSRHMYLGTTMVFDDEDYTTEMDSGTGTEMGSGSDICVTTRPCQNGGLCILPINEVLFESEIITNEFECACPPGFRGSTCGEVIVECDRNELTCGSGECVPLNKKCDQVSYDCADNSDEDLLGHVSCYRGDFVPDCGFLHHHLDSMTDMCGEISEPYSRSATLGNKRIWHFQFASNYTSATNVIFKITIDVTPFMGIEIVSDGTLFVALHTKSGIRTPVVNIKISYQNGEGRRKFEKMLTDIYSIGVDQLVSLSFLPDGSSNHTSLSYFRCSNQQVICLTVSIRSFVPGCKNTCLGTFVGWIQATYEKRFINCGITSIDSVIYPLYEECLWCVTKPCENGGLCILPINLYSSNKIECACPPGFNGSTCAGVIVECGRNEFACTSGECVPLSKKCDNVPYDCADNSDEPDGECNNAECGDLLPYLDSMTEMCGESNEANSSSVVLGCFFFKFPSFRFFTIHVIFKIMIDVTPYMGFDISSDGTLFVAFLSERGIKTPVFNIRISYQNGEGQTRFHKILTDIYIMGVFEQLVSLSFLPDGTANQTSLSYFRCSNQQVICLTLSIRSLEPGCKNTCIEKYADWRQAIDEKRDLNCGISSIDRAIDQLYEECLTVPFGSGSSSVSSSDILSVEDSNKNSDFVSDVEDCREVDCEGGGYCDQEGYECVCPVGRFGRFCEIDICETIPCENGGLCILAINELFSESEIVSESPTSGFECACPPGFRGSTCAGVIVECGRNEFACTSGECVPLSKKCDNFPYDCADNSDEPVGECNNAECGDLLPRLDSITHLCGGVFQLYSRSGDFANGQNLGLWYFYHRSFERSEGPSNYYPDTTNIIFKISIDVSPYMGIEISSNGTLVVALLSERGIQTPVFYIKISYQNGYKQTRFEKYLSNIYSMDSNGQLVSLSFLPDGSANQTSLSYFKCRNREVSCLTLSVRSFLPSCNNNMCIEKYADWRKASDEKRDLNCGVTSIDSVIDPLYEQCLIPPFITSISENMNVGIGETFYLYCVASGVPTPTLQWVEITEAGESIYIGKQSKEQVVYGLSDLSSTKRFACLAVNVVDELLSEDIVISREDPVCTDLYYSTRGFSVSNPVCYNETVDDIPRGELWWVSDGFSSYTSNIIEGSVLYSVSFSAESYNRRGDGSFSASTGHVVFSTTIVISNVITGAVIYSQVVDGIIMHMLFGRSRIYLSFDQPIKINSTSRYEILVRISDPAFQLADYQPLEINGVTCAKDLQECRQFINDWNGLIADEIDAGCDDIDVQHTAAELCFGEFFGDPEVIRHPESQLNDVGLTSTLECNIGNVEFYEWYKNGELIPRSGPTYSLLIEDGHDQGDYVCVGFRSQDLKDARSKTATVLITGVSTFRVLVRFNILFERGYTDRESDTFKNFTSALQKSLESELPPFELFVASLQSGSVITEMEIYFFDQTQNASSYSMMINGSLASLSEYQTDPSSIIVTSISNCIGEDVTKDGILYSFPDVLLDTTAESIQFCPLYSDQGITVSLATRYCGGNFVSGAEWAPIIVSDCDIGTTSAQIQRINEVEVTERNCVQVAVALARFTDNTAALDEDSVIRVSIILEDIVALEMADDSITLNVVEIVNNVIESGVLETDKSMRETASSFVKSLERQLATVAAAGMNFTSVQPRVSVMTLVVSSDTLKNGIAYVAFSDGDSLKDNFEPDDVKTFFEKTFPIDMVASSIALPSAIISINQAQTGEDEIRMYFTVYQHSSLFISNKLANESGEEFTRQVGSQVISASIEAVKIDGLVYPIKAAFLHRFEIIKDTECVFWDFSLDDGLGEWSSEGCTYNETADDRVICFCDHLTNFAILVDYYEPKKSKFQDVLTVISLIGCIVSIVCLAITITTYLYFKQFRSKRPQKILINLSISLLLLYLVFAIGIEKTSSKNGCIAVAALIHYFGLASVFWMSIEAINMYLMFVKVFYDDTRYFMLKVCALGYGAPLVIVAICFGIDVDNYANEHYCFIPSGNVRNVGFILVIGVLLLCNCVIFVLVMYTLTCGRKVAKTIDRSKKRELVVKRLQNAIAVSVLLGLTWVFGFLAIDSDSSARDVFQAFFCIFNSLQGFFIFLLFCVRQKDIREAWKGCCNGGDRAKRVRYTTDTSNKGKVKDHSIPLTSDFTQSTTSKSNERV